MEMPAILLIIFNRPDFSRKMYNVLEKIRPPKLYVISDGARDENEGIEVNKSRDIFNNISWPCNVNYNYSDFNLGLFKRITSGIDWAFENETELIILEDDCIPHPDFFKFCEEMLIRYANDKRVMTINGCNLNPELSKGFSDSYFFSKYSNSWGWATWKRSWKLFDRNLSGMDSKLALKNFTYNFLYRKRSSIYWNYKLGLVKKSKINSWAYRWMFTLWIQNGLAIVPQNNLIKNIGNDERSSNTRGKLHYLNIDSKSLFNDKELTYPKYIHASVDYDKWLENSIYSKSIGYRLKWLFYKVTFQI